MTSRSCITIDAILSRAAPALRLPLNGDHNKQLSYEPNGRAAKRNPYLAKFFRGLGPPSHIPRTRCSAASRPPSRSSNHRLAEEEKDKAWSTRLKEQAPPAVTRL